MTKIFKKAKIMAKKERGKMKIIRVFIAFIAISLVVGLGFAFNGQSFTQNNVVDEQKKEVQEVKQIVDNEFETEKPVLEEKAEEQKKEEVKEETKEIVKKETPKIESSSNTSSSKLNNSSSASKPAKSDSTNSNNTKEENKVVEKPIWEKLGMTENQYYNQPIMSWQRVDFSVEKYKTEDKAMEACLSHGDNYEPYKNGEVLYMCDKVFSASGKFLGVMFDTETLVN